MALTISDHFQQFVQMWLEGDEQAQIQVSKMTLSCTTKTWYALIQDITQLRSEGWNKQLCPEASKSKTFLMFLALIVMEDKSCIHGLCYRGLTV